MIHRLPLAFLTLVLLTTAAFAEIVEPKKAEPSPFDHLEFRNVGPVNISGRVADIEGVPGRPNVVYVGAASGGVWKTTDGGLTFKPIFDDEPIASIGDLALAPSNPEVIYVGTGESATKNSVSFGNGVYKSTDGAESWTYLGLEDTRHISRVLDPTNPNVLFAALLYFERKPWTLTSGSEEGGVFRSVDGGKTWKKLTEGLPKLMGRIAVRDAEQARCLRSQRASLRDEEKPRFHLDLFSLGGPRGVSPGGIQDLVQVQDEARQFVML